MINNDINVGDGFAMRVNLNLKGIGGEKSQIWLAATINKERARVYTGLLVEPQYWIKKTRTQVGERVIEGGTLGKPQS